MTSIPRPLPSSFQQSRSSRSATWTEFNIGKKTNLTLTGHVLCVILPTYHKMFVRRSALQSRLSLPTTDQMTTHSRNLRIWFYMTKSPRRSMKKIKISKWSSKSFFPPQSKPRPVYTIHYKLYTINYTLYTVHYTLYTVHYTLYIIHYTLYIYTIYYKLYTIHYTLYTSGCVATQGRAICMVREQSSFRRGRLEDCYSCW